jgi:hypothetical protein
MTRASARQCDELTTPRISVALSWSPSELISSQNKVGLAASITRNIAVGLMLLVASGRRAILARVRNRLDLPHRFVGLSTVRRGEMNAASCAWVWIVQSAAARAA